MKEKILAAVAVVAVAIISAVPAHADDPSVGSSCLSGQINQTATSSTGTRVRCLANAESGYIWMTDTGVTQDPWSGDQFAWAVCKKQGYSDAECHATFESDDKVLGPEGYGRPAPVTLGMTKAEVRATGQTTGTSTAPEGACGGPGDGLLVGSPSPTGTSQSPTPTKGQLFFDQAGILVAIYAFDGIKTPEGITLGSTYDQLHAAYPTWEQVSDPGSGDPTNGRGGVAVPGNPNAHFRIVVANQKVIELSLDSDKQDCYE